MVCNLPNTDGRLGVQSDAPAYFMSTEPIRASRMETILIIEDEPHLREWYRQELEDRGYTVLSASHLREVEQMIRTHEVDLVVLDLKLKDGSGFDLLHEILGRKKDIKVIIHTAYPMFKGDFRSWGADAFLVKSSDLTELLQTIGRLLATEKNELPAYS